jgi:hypothetical protein
MAVAVRGCPQRSGRSRPGRGPSAALVDASLDQSTPCLQSQIGGVRHLQWIVNRAGRGCWRVVRGCPLGTGQDCCEWHASGTAGEDNVHGAWQCRHQLDRKVGLDPGDACVVGKGRRPAAEITWGSNPPSCHSAPRGSARECTVTCDSCMPAVTVRAHQRLAVPGAVRIQHGPSGCGPCAVEPVLRYHCDRTDALARPWKAGVVRDGFVHTYRR